MYMYCMCIYSSRIHSLAELALNQKNFNSWIRLYVWERWAVIENQVDAFIHDYAYKYSFC